MHEQKNRFRGFTLIELLVVVAIISLLAAILFPVFARARENARRASCMSNLKQLSLSVMQYTQDYDEHLPPYWNGRASTGDFWMSMVSPYVKNWQVFYCPSDTGGLDSSKQPTYSQSNYGMAGRYLAKTNVPNEAGDSVGWGKPGCEIPKGGSGCGGIALSSVEFPSETVLLTDKDAGSAGELVDLKTASYRPSQRHFDGTNVAFVEGHVKWMSYRKLFDYNGNGKDDDGYLCLTKKIPSSSCWGN